MKDLLRKAYKAGRRNALNLSDKNFNDFVEENADEIRYIEAVKSLYEDEVGSLNKEYRNNKDAW